MHTTRNYDDVISGKAEVKKNEGCSLKECSLLIETQLSIKTFLTREIIATLWVLTTTLAASC